MMTLIVPAQLSRPTRIAPEAVGEHLRHLFRYSITYSPRKLRHMRIRRGAVPFDSIEPVVTGSQYLIATPRNAKECDRFARRSR